MLRGKGEKRSLRGGSSRLREALKLGFFPWVVFCFSFYFRDNWVHFTYVLPIYWRILSSPPVLLLILTLFFSSTAISLLTLRIYLKNEG